MQLMEVSLIQRRDINVSIRFTSNTGSDADMRYYGKNDRKPRKIYSEKEYRKLNVPDFNDTQKNGDRPEELLKRQKAKRTSRAKKISAIAAGLVLIAGFSILVPRMSASAAYSEGFEVLLNGQSLGVTDDPQTIQDALTSIEEEFREDYGMQIYDDTSLEFIKVKISSQYICPADVYVQILKENIDVKVMAWVINVNSRAAVALKTQDEAAEVLQRVLEPYQEVAEDNERTEIDFVENVEVVNETIEYSNITDVDSAFNIMVYGLADYEEKWHIVVTGDTLSEIAHKYDIKVSDLRKANLSVAATDSIYPGDELLVIVPNNCVNVKYTKIINRDEEYEADPEYIYDDSMYVTEKYVQQEGTAGYWHVTAKTVYINGIEASYEILDSTIYEEAVAQIIVKGTKEVSKVMEMAAEGEIPFPLEKGTYYISSPFGYRDISDQLESASTFHKGIDLAANKGTPIYAPLSGTVTFSGSSSGYGLLIKIDHGDGVETRYGHCSQLLVEKGEKVKAGQLIGLVGNTGGSTGSHLHFEIRLNGVPQDPEGKYTGDIPGY